MHFTTNVKHLSRISARGTNAGFFYTRTIIRLFSEIVSDKLNRQWRYHVVAILLGYLPTDDVQTHVLVPRVSGLVQAPLITFP